jgi:hypothetical protein
MKRLYAWLAGFAGGAALYRAFRRGPEPAADPAAALKAKLADARAGGEPEEPPPAAAAEPPEAAVDDRRRAVHEQGRAAIDEMRPDELRPK